MFYVLAALAAIAAFTVTYKADYKGPEMIGALNPDNKAT